MQRKGTGIRKINFKDFFTEPADAGIPSLWEGPVSANWSVGIGHGQLPSVWKGRGYRAIAAQGDPSSMFAVTPPPWGTLDQTIAGRKRMLQFDYMIRFNTYVEDPGIAFMFLVTHSGAPLYTVSRGYRVRIDSAGVTLEKIDVGGGILIWTTVMNGIDPGSEAFTVSPDTDYYIRVTYFPEDIDAYAGYAHSTAGFFAVAIDTDKDKIGQGNTLLWGFQDDTPMVGTAYDTIGFDVFSYNDAEIDGVTYSDGFIDLPQYLHYFSSMHELGQTLNLKFHQSGEEPWDWLDNGDRVELWLKERRITVGGDPYAVISDEYLTICKMDGVVRMVKDKGNEEFAHVLVRDEFRTMLIQKKGHQNITVAKTDYYTYIIDTFLSEYQGEAAKITRLCFPPGFSSTTWSAINISANWTLKGNFWYAFRTLGLIVNAWYFWLPYSILISQTAPVPTNKMFDMVRFGEVQWIQEVIASDEKEEGYQNDINEYHDDGFGGVTLTNVQNAADIAQYGPSTEERIDVNAPPVEGAIIADNRYLQQNEKSKIVDILCPFYGLDFHVGCQVGINMPNIGIDEEDDYVIIEEELINIDMETEDDIRGYHRFKLAYLDQSEEHVERLPREEIRPRGEVIEWRTKQDYHSALFT